MEKRIWSIVAAETEDENKHRSLCKAIIKGDFPAAMRLWDVMTKEEKNGLDDKSRTPLYLAVEQDNMAIALKIMMDPDVDLNTKCTVKNKTVLQIADEKKYVSLVSLLILDNRIQLIAIPSINVPVFA